MNKLNKININNILLFFVILSYPINIKIFFILRPLDLFILIFLVININKLNYGQIKFLFIVLIFLLISSLVGYYFDDKVNFKKIAYVFKYFTPLIFFFILYNLNFSKNYINIFYKLLFTSFLLICIYNPVISLFEIVPEKINTYHFPFTYLNSNKGDKHVLGATIGFLTIYLIIFNNLKNNYINKWFNIRNIFILIISIVSAILIKSITLTISLLICLLYMCHSNIYQIVKNRNKLKYLYFFYILVLTIFIFLIVYFKIKYSDELGLYINYSTIELARFNNLFYNFPSNYSTLLFGSGILTTPLFIDQGLLTLIHSFGLIAVFIFFICFINSDFYLKIDTHSKFFLVFIICINLFVTEFFLLSRYIYPLIICVLFYYKLQLSFTKDN